MSTDNERRLVRVEFSGELFRDLFFVTPPDRAFAVTAGLPDGAEYVRTAYDPMVDAVSVFWRHPSFGVVPVSDQVPRFDVQYTGYHASNGMTMADAVKCASQNVPRPKRQLTPAEIEGIERLLRLLERDPPCKWADGDATPTAVVEGGK